jgi:hypothetical protein
VNDNDTNGIRNVDRGFIAAYFITGFYYTVSLKNTVCLTFKYDCLLKLSHIYAPCIKKIILYENDQTILTSQYHIDIRMMK